LQERVETASMASEQKKESKGTVLNMILRNVTLCINRLHIRYEDDYYAYESPFACGILCEVRSD
jgi:hypothetical protein